MVTRSYRVSKPEIARRGRAFIALAVTWPLALSCGSLLLPTDRRVIALSLAAAISVFMIVIGSLTIPYLRRTHLRTVYEIEAKTLKRVVRSKVKEVISFNSVRQIHIKYVSQGAIRQITLTDEEGRRHNIDGAENFEQLRDVIIKACPATPVSSWREPINYDHYLFYPALGVGFAGISILAVALLGASGRQVNRVLIACVVAFCFGVAAYIAKVTPLARQYGSSSKKIDWLLAAILIGVAMVVGAISVML